MRMFRILFVAITYICILTFDNASANQTNDSCKAAIDAGNPCPAGCGYSSTAKTCAACGTNTFSNTPNSNCNPCPGNSTSSSGATSCTCPDNTTIDPNGTWEPDTRQITSGECTYTDTKNLTCKNSDNMCNGYHKEGSECKPNQTTCSDAENHIANGIKYYNDTKCYATRCDNNYFLNNAVTNPKCSSHTNLYTQCTDSIPCTQDLKNCISETNSRGISGNITANGTSKNYSACECRNEQTVDISNGKGTQVCKYSGGSGTSTTWAICTTDTVTQCDEKYCELNNSKKCEKVKAGYYSTGTEKTCHACDAGSTSDAGSTARTDCYISSETQFLDDFGNTFTLPIPQIKYQ